MSKHIHVIFCSVSFMIGVNYLFDREITNVIEVMVLMSLYTIFLVFGIDCYKVFLFFGKV